MPLENKRVVFFNTNQKISFPCKKPNRWKPQSENKELSREYRTYAKTLHKVGARYTSPLQIVNFVSYSKVLSAEYSPQSTKGL
ncbi:hypothetical protein AVDCRST_MAG92-5341 [uncultured Coleofasciculus sp.]|uniref:Uncharacterized protein n=1 Tax=uncultured Coleofasciculus sp. TaxID=1267456 RepID=A0A6J4KGM5_9CYAN|nr:hypothetical protein AVDCRST_MAG92-5341 [uncultured Coleofasciculus sp.]